MIRFYEKTNKATPSDSDIFIISSGSGTSWSDYKVTWAQLKALIKVIDDMTNYYTKSQVYTKDEVENLIGDLVKFEVVQTLPTTDISQSTIYLVPKNPQETNDVYEEYINLDGTSAGWEKIGETSVDLSNYYTKTETESYVKGDGATYIINTATFSTLTTSTKTIVGAINEIKGAIPTLLSDLSDDSTHRLVTDAEKAAWDNKVDKVTGKGLSENDYTTTEKNKLAGITANATKVSASDTNGNIKINETETPVYDDTEIDERLDNVEQDLSTDTATVTGNPINFTTLTAQKAVETVISLEPIQDLHGYDNPWPAGGGKNKFDYDTTYADFKQSDGTFRGVANVVYLAKYRILSELVGSQLTFSVFLDLTDSGTLTWVRCRANVSGSWVNGSKVENGTNQYSSVTFTPTSTDDYVVLEYGSSGSNLYTFSEIQLEVGALRTSFAPYSNYCPIDGRTETSLVGCGKNQLPMTVDEIKAANINGTWNGNVYTVNGITWALQSDGTVIANGTATANSQYRIPFSGLSGNLYFNGCPSGGGNNIYDVYAWDDTTNTRYYKWNGTTFSGSDYGSYDSQEVNIPEGHDGKIICRIFSGTTVNNIHFKPMLRLATENDATFEPYVKSNDLTIQFGEKVYGATVELEKGTVTVEWGYIASYNGETLPGEWISDRDVYAPNTSPSTGAEVVYELATPRTITLTPNEISLLSGVNNISTDGNSISLTYRDGKVATLGDLDGLVKKIADCEDVEITDLQAGDSLVWDATAGKWKNQANTSMVVYDGTEQVIGTWFGETLYQKSFEFTPEADTNNHVLDSTLTSSAISVKTIIKGAYEIGGTYDGAVFAGDDIFTDDLPNRMRCFVNTNGLSYNFQRYNAQYPFTRATVIIQYTKTTPTLLTQPTPTEEFTPADESESTDENR